jgi:hypothetical protein
MCVAGGKRCEYSNAISNVRKKARHKFREDYQSERERKVEEAVREWKEDNSEMVMAHLPEKLGFQVTPPSRPVPQSLLEYMGDRKEVVTGATTPEEKASFYQNLFDRREEWFSRLNDEEDNAVSFYAMNAFEAMNLHLRRHGYAAWARNNQHLYDGWKGETAQTYLNDVVKTRIAGLDSALKKAVAPDEPQKLYRFFRVPAGVKPQDYVKKYFRTGEGFKDRGYMSATADPEFLTAHIMDRSGGTRNKGYVVLEMLTSAGASLQPESTPNGARIQSLEAEVLLPRNTGMRIVETGSRKFEFGQDRDEMTRKFSSRSRNHYVYCDEGAGLRLPVIRMIDENLIREVGTGKKIF